MYYRSSFDKTGECSRMGEKAEVTFGKLLQKKGKVRMASDREQMRHIDFILTDSEGRHVKYDVKARKRISRSDDEVSDDKVWIEFLNVNGDLGWLYGQSDYIVFERNKDFLIINRIRLKDFAEDQCDLAQLVTSPQDALYFGYRRVGRKDLVSMVKMDDLAKLAEEIWPKIPA
jgi:hypothetical protein